MAEEGEVPTESSSIDVLRREEEQVDSNSCLDALFGADSIERILNSEKSLLLVGTVQLWIFSMFERSWTNSWKGSLENVELTTEIFLKHRSRLA